MTFPTPALIAWSTASERALDADDFYTYSKLERAWDEAADAVNADTDSDELNALSQVGYHNAIAARVLLPPSAKHYL